MVSEDLRNHLKLAWEAIERGEYKEALQHCKSALKLDKTSYDALVLIGKAATQLQEYQQAELAFRRAIDVDRELVPAWKGLADLFSITTNIAGVIEANQQLVEAMPADDPISRDARLRLAEAFSRSADFPKALTQYYTLLSHETPCSPGHLDILCKLADLQLKLDENKAAEEMEARLTAPAGLSGRTMSSLQLDVLSEQATLDDESGDVSLLSTLAAICNTAPPGLQYLKYREEMLKRCLLKIFSAPPRSTERQYFRLSALRDCAAIIASGGSCTSLPYEAAIWLLEEEEEVTGGQAPVGGQEVGGRLAVAGGVQAGAEALIGSGRHGTIAYAFENFARRMAHQFPTNSTARVCVALMLRRRGAHDHRPVPQTKRRQLEQLLAAAMEDGRNDCASGYKALAELQYENRQYDAACSTALKGLKWLHARRQKGHEALTQIALSLRLALAKSLRRLGKLDEAETHFKSLAGWVTEGEAGFGDMCGSTPVSIHQQALRGIALVALARGDRAGARAQYERILGKAALGRGPAEHWAHADYGWLLYQDGDLQGARSQLEQALNVAVAEGCAATDSQVGEHHYRLGEVYWRLKGRYRTEKRFAYTQFLEAAKVEGHAQAPALAALGRYFDQIEHKPDQATRCYKKALALDPSVDVAGDGLCYHLVKAGKQGAAELLCREITSRDATAAWAHKRLGFLYTSRSAYDEAIPEFQSALRLQPSEATTWEGLGACYQPLGRFTAALKAYGKALELEPDRVYSLVQSGSLYLNLGSPADSLKSYQTALNIDATHPAALLGASQALAASAASLAAVGAMQVAADLAEAAAQHAAQCAAQHSSLQAAWKQLGDVLLLHYKIPPRSSYSLSKEKQSSGVGVVKEQVQRMQQAKRAYAKALHLRPNHPAAYSDIAATFYHEKQLRRTHITLTSSSSSPLSANTTSFSSPSSLPLLAELAHKAERLLKSGLQISPTSSELWTSFGAVASSPSTREYALHRALQLDPKSTLAWAVLARLYIDSNQPALAERCLTQARSHDPTVAYIWEAMAALASLSPSGGKDRAEYSEHATGLGSGGEGLLGFIDSAIRNGGSGIASIDRGVVYAAARKGVELDPLNPAMHNALGLVNEARGDCITAVESYRTALRMLASTPATIGNSAAASGALLINPQTTSTVGVDGSKGASRLEIGVKLNLARALCSAQRFSESVALYGELEFEAELDHHPIALLSYAQARFMNGDLSGAEGSLASAVRDTKDAGVAVQAVQMMIQIKASSASAPSQGGVLAALHTLQQYMPVLQSLKASAEDIERLFITLMAVAAVAGVSPGSEGLIDLVESEARAWARSTDWEQAPFIAQLLSVKASAASISGRPRTSMYYHSKAVYTCPWSIDLRTSLAAGAAAQHSVPGYAEAAQHLINDPFVLDNNLSLTKTTPLSSSAAAAVSGGSYTKAKSKDQRYVDTILQVQATAALVRSSSAVKALLRNQSNSAAKAIHENPCKSESWYLGAVVSTRAAAGLSGNVRTKSALKRAAAWCQAAAYVYELEQKHKPHSSSVEALWVEAHLAVCNSECVLNEKGDVAAAGAALDPILTALEAGSDAVVMSDLQAMLLRQQARCNWKADNIDAAEDSYIKAGVAARREFEIVAVALEYSQLLQRSHRSEQGIQILKQAITKCSTSTVSELGSYSKRNSEFSGTLLLRLAVALMQMNRPEDAKRAVQHAFQQQEEESTAAHSLKTLTALTQGAAALQTALKLQSNSQQDKSVAEEEAAINAALGEARKLLGECLKYISPSNTSALVLGRALLAQAESAGNLRRKQERVQSHIEEILAVADRESIQPELLGLLGSLAGSKSICAKALHVAPWKQSVWDTLKECT